MPTDEERALPIVSRSHGLHVREVHQASRSARFVASTDALDSYDEVVEQSWRLDRYKKNPVVLYGHMSKELPIGTATDTGLVNGQLETTITFVSEKANPKAEQVWQLIQEGALRAVSVGFNPHNIRREVRDDQDVYVLSDNELYEISVVPIPANAEALMKMRERAMGDAKRGAVSYDGYPPKDGSWDGAAASGRMRKWASSDGSGDKEKMDWARYRTGFAWYDASNAQDFGSYKLPHHDIVDGSIVTVRGGVIAAGNVVQGGRGGVNISDSDMVGVKSHLEKHYHQFDIKAPWEPKAADEAEEKDSDMTTEEQKALEAKNAELLAKLNLATERGAQVEGENKALATKLAESDKALEAEKAKTATLSERCATLETERASQQKRADELAQTAVERDLDELVGKKISPAEKPGLVKLSLVSKVLYDEQLAAIKSRPDMLMTERVVGSDPVLPPATTDDGDGGDALSASIEKQLSARN